MTRKIRNDLTGKRFGRLTVSHLDLNVGRIRWVCKCDCGNDKSISYNNIVSGKATSCGCYNKDKNAIIAAKKRNVLELIDNCIEIIIQSKDGKQTRAVVDIDDLDLIKTTTWRRSGKYVMSGTGVLLHRMIMNAPAGLDVDHINHNTLDNRKGNLRIVTRQQNLQNLKGCHGHNKSSKLRGVSWHKRSGKWQAYVHYNYKQITVGYFTTADEAHKAVSKWRMENLKYSRESAL